jgi:hypothetical protein
MMFELRPNEKFEPSKDVKNLWTYTRKSSFNAAGIKLPGLFITKGFDIDAAAFVAVIFLELWGLYSIVSSIGLLSSEGAFNVLGLAVIVALFLIDVALALLRHLPAGPECRYKNHEVLATSPQARQKLRNERGARMLLTPLCSILILGVAGVKIYGFYMLNGGEINGLTVSVLVSYLFAALLHINNTGYFLYGLAFNRKIRREYSRWSNDADDAHEYTIYGRRQYPVEIPNEDKIKIREVSAGKHRITSEATGTAEQVYLIETYGILTDRELQALVVQQRGDNAQSTIARAGLEAQLDILDASPLPQTAEGSRHLDEEETEGDRVTSTVRPFPDAAKAATSK